MHGLILLKGMLVGFLIAAPVGPINVLCVRRTLVHGRLAGIVSGPFGIFREDTNGPDRGFTQPRFSLVLLACGRFLSTSARRIDCQVLAEELAPLEVAWTATDPHAVTGPGIEAAVGSSGAVSADTRFEPSEGPALAGPHPASAEGYFLCRRT